MDSESKEDGASSKRTTSKKAGDKRKSEVWHHYWDVKDLETGKVVQVKCKYCDGIVSYSVSNDTSSMKKHLNTCPKHPKNVDKKQKLISVFRSSQSETTTISNWEFDQNASRLALAKMIIVDEQPFSFVEREGFKYFCSVTCPQFVVPSRFTIARDCKKLYICEREQLKNILEGLKSRVALTTDCWTSIQNFNYLCLTAHFIDDSWKLHKIISKFQLMDGHKGKEIEKVVETCILEWGIEEKISCVTVDNASSNDVAISHLRKNLSDKLVLGGEFFHMRCAAHVLNLIVRDGLSKVKN